MGRAFVLAREAWLVNGPQKSEKNQLCIFIEQINYAFEKNHYF